MRSIRLLRTAALAAALACALPPPGHADDARRAEQIVDVVQPAVRQAPRQPRQPRQGHRRRGQLRSPAPPVPRSAAPRCSQGGPIPVTARFSDATGLPAIPDGDPNANPHGMAVRFHLPGRQRRWTSSPTRWRSSRSPPPRTSWPCCRPWPPSGPDAAKPTPVDRFVAAHPAVPAATGSVADAVQLRARDLQRRQRLRLRRRRRQAPAVPLRDHAGRRRGPPDRRGRGRAGAGLPDRRAAGPARQGAGPVPPRRPAGRARRPDRPMRPSPGPPTASWSSSARSPSTAWTPTAPPPPSELLFLPTNLIDGIEPSDDPLIDARTAAYAISFDRRTP